MTNSTGGRSTKRFVLKWLKVHVAKVLAALKINHAIKSSDVDVNSRRKVVSHKHSRYFRVVNGEFGAVFHAVYELCTGCVIQWFALEQVEVVSTMTQLLRQNMAEIVTLNVILNESSDPHGRLEPLIEVHRGISGPKFGGGQG